MKQKSDSRERLHNEVASPFCFVISRIDKTAEDMFFRLVKEMAEKQGATEQLKATDQMLWVGRMNDIRNSAMEVVNREIIFV